MIFYFHVEYQSINLRIDKFGYYKLYFKYVRGLPSPANGAGLLLSYLLYIYR
jgi:hypothetical protein